jgi:hypothetical protein
MPKQIRVVDASKAKKPEVVGGQVVDAIGSRAEHQVDK